LPRRRTKVHPDKLYRRASDVKPKPPTQREHCQPHEELRLDAHPSGVLDTCPTPEVQWHVTVHSFSPGAIAGRSANFANQERIAHGRPL
jgi:hypothetical protein